MDAIYLLVLKVQVTKFDSAKYQHNIDVEIQWRGPHGYLSAIDYPLLLFYGFMCMFYMALATWWLVVCLKYWKDLLRIQFWIGRFLIH